jgi:hypothetical protein
VLVILGIKAIDSLDIGLGLLGVSLHRLGRHLMGVLTSAQLAPPSYNRLLLKFCNFLHILCTGLSWVTIPLGLVVKKYEVLNKQTGYYYFLLAATIKSF